MDTNTNEHKSHTEEIGEHEICPCNPKKKTPYGKCCKRRGYVKWHIDFATNEPYRTLIMTDPVFVQLLSDYKKIRDEKHGTDPNKPFFLQEDGSPMPLNYFSDLQLRLFTPLLSLRVVDPCFFYCIVNLDFIPSYWRYIWPKQERKIRKQEWNTAVYTYIKTKHMSDYYEIRIDKRSGKQIKLLNKMGLYGTLEKQKCLNCNKSEKKRI
eukprot:464898_1